MRKQKEELFYTTLQKEQIELGRENGLNEREIREYAKRRFNFRQMEEIRLAIEHNTDPKQRRYMCRARYSPEKMKELRLRLEHGELLSDPVIPSAVWKTAPVLVFAQIALISLCTKAAERPYLHLTQEEVVLKEGEHFDPLLYVKEYSKGEGTLILPEDISTEFTGNKAAVYHFLSRGEDIMRTLRVSVIPKK